MNNMSKWILRDGQEIYIGKTYIYQGNFFPCTSYLLEEAKIYKSKKIAENSCKKLNDKVDGGWEFKVYELM